MERRIDTNAVIRYVLQDVGHPNYVEATGILQLGGVVGIEVFPEIAFVFSGATKRVLAEEDAKEKGKLDEFYAGPRLYTFLLRTYPSGWKKTMYKNLEAGMKVLLDKYPHVHLERPDLYWKAVEIAKDTGYDWVDCFILARYEVDGAIPASIDKDIAKYLTKHKKPATTVGKLEF